jgi:death-on-curing protein
MPSTAFAPLEGVHPDIQAEFQRCCQEVGPESPLLSDAVTAEGILRAHFMLAEYFQRRGEGLGGVGPRSLHLLQSAVSRQYVSLGSTRKWNTVYELTATLFFGVVKNHPFFDANKRTALLTALYQLQRAGRTPTVSHKELEALTLRTADDTLDTYGHFDRVEDSDDPEVQFIAFFLKRNTREIDNRYYLITNTQLNAILARFGAWLDNPHANRIDVLQTVEEHRGIISFGKKKFTKRVASIGFHDWGSEVSRGDIKTVREALNLTPEHGVDSQVFYQGVDPLASLLLEYAAPLQRLARK